ncbi:hypothetical protein AXF42_Ash011226 [Apostasia shenzhenica]|uniref:Uncharacterized protein n=1 Tax=Apostasia shenzhenica TaxID=1088818 RepID=A0A2I0ALG4_9ASPA|nr:hypothetical protein AXF42_Ash011226 [Apostasia shenzhenica]
MIAKQNTNLDLSLSIPPFSHSVVPAVGPSEPTFSISKTPPLFPNSNDAVSFTGPFESSLSSLRPPSSLPILEGPLRPMGDENLSLQTASKEPSTAEVSKAVIVQTASPVGACIENKEPPSHPSFDSDCEITEEFFKNNSSKEATRTQTEEVPVRKDLGKALIVEVDLSKEGLIEKPSSSRDPFAIAASNFNEYVPPTSDEHNQMREWIQYFNSTSFDVHASLERLWAVIKAHTHNHLFFDANVCPLF